MIDRKAKRSPKKLKTHYGINDVYKYYVDSGGELSPKVFKSLIKEFNKEVSRMIVEESFEYLIPRRLGAIRIKKNKPRITLDENGNVDKKFLTVNWHATLKLWEKNENAKDKKQLVYHTNEHTNGYVYKWYYSKYRSNLPNKTAYSFEPSRTNKQLLTYTLKNNEHIDYYE